MNEASLIKQIMISNIEELNFTNPEQMKDSGTGDITSGTHAISTGNSWKIVVELRQNNFTP